MAQRSLSLDDIEGMTFEAPRRGTSLDDTLGGAPAGAVNDSTPLPKDKKKKAKKGPTATRSKMAIPDDEENVSFLLLLTMEDARFFDKGLCSVFLLLLCHGFAGRCQKE